MESKRDEDTSREGSYRTPMWNQEFQFLVEDPQKQVSWGSAASKSGRRLAASALVAMQC